MALKMYMEDLGDGKGCKVWYAQKPNEDMHPMKDKSHDVPGGDAVDLVAEIERFYDLKRALWPGPGLAAQVEELELCRSRLRDMFRARDTREGGVIVDEANPDNKIICRKCGRDFLCPSPHHGNLICPTCGENPKPIPAQLQKGTAQGNAERLLCSVCDNFYWIWNCRKEGDCPFCAEKALKP